MLSLARLSTARPGLADLLDLPLAAHVVWLHRDSAAELCPHPPILKAQPFVLDRVLGDLDRQDSRRGCLCRAGSASGSTSGANSRITASRWIRSARAASACCSSSVMWKATSRRFLSNVLIRFAYCPRRSGLSIWAFRQLPSWRIVGHWALGQPDRLYFLVAVVT